MLLPFVYGLPLELYAFRNYNDSGILYQAGSVLSPIFVTGK